MAKPFQQKGVWYARIRIRTRVWRNRAMPTARSRREATELQAEIQRAVDARPVERIPGRTVAAEFDAWMERRKARGLRDLRAERSHFATHVLPRIGEMPLEDVRRGHIIALVDALPERKLSPKTTHNVLSTLRRFWHDVEMRDLIDASPFRLPPEMIPRKLPKDPRFYERAILTADEVRTILAASIVPIRRRVAYALGMLAGLRAGEVCGLRWSDLDETATPLARLTVARSYDGPTKTRSVRAVPVHPALLALLGRWRPHCAGPLVAPGRKGEMLSDVKLRHAWSDDLVRLGLRHRRFHDTRRTFVSLCREGGAYRDVLERVTHSGVGDMLDRYSTYSWEALCGAVSCLVVAPDLLAICSLAEHVREPDGATPRKDRCSVGWATRDSKTRPFAERACRSRNPPGILRSARAGASARGPNRARFARWRASATRDTAHGRIAA